MELTEKNGHASIEEILASVRRIIAEEPGQTAPIIDLGKPMQYPRGDGLLDDPSDFDLPSMFKTPSATPSADKPAPLFGRLSEAIRAASSNGHTANGQSPTGHSANGHGGGERNDHGLSSLNLHRAEPADTTAAPHFLLATFHETTSPRIDELAASATNDVKAPIPAPVLGSPPAEANMMHATFTAPDPAPAPVETATPAPQVPRQMAAFKDTRFRGMGSAPAAMAPMQPSVSPFEAAATAALVQAASPAPAVEPAATMPSPAEDLPVLMSPVLMSEEQSAAGDFAVEAPRSLAAAIAASYPSLAPDPAPSTDFIPITPAPMAAAPVVAAPIEHVPPPVPASMPQEAATTTATPAPIEDSTADLLRPMLRQWLAENMPRMVEKALHIEVAESVKTPRK
jgi:cell pole-organizing protein PopZ